MASVAVIGAGIGGLAAALRLVTSGHDVTIFEAAPQAGGKIGIETRGGIEFDTGPSVLTMPDVFEGLFAAAGAEFSDHVELVRHEHVFDYFWPDGTRLPVYFETEQTLEGVARILDPEAADELRAFLGYAEDIWNAAAPAFVYGDAPTFSNTVSLGLRTLASLRKIDPMRTMMEGIRRHVSNPYLVDVLARYGTYNGSDPWQAPATLNCIAHVELARGCYGVRGGMYELVRAIEGLLASRGASFRFDTFVERLLTAGTRPVVVTGTDATTFDAVVANADAAHLFEELLEPAPDREAGEPSMSGWTAVLQASRVERAPHTAYFPNNYQAEFSDIFQAGRAPREPTIYICAQERAHGRAGSAEGELLFVMANAPALHAGSADDATHLRAAAERRLRELGWWDGGTEVLWQRGPSGLASRFPGSKGAIYGASSNSRFSAFQRPANRLGGVRGVYLASGSAHPGGGVPLCALSGAAAARAVNADFG